MRRVAHETKPDVAHVHNTWFSLTPSVVRALRDADVPVVVTLHNYRLVCVNALLLRDGRPCTDCVGRSPLPGVLRRCYRSSTVASGVVAATLSLNRVRHTWTEHVNRFVAPSEALRDHLAIGGLPRERIVVRPHAVADPGPRVGVPSMSSTVVYAGRISEEKGIAVLLDAWQRRQPRGLELVVAGDGPCRSELEARRVNGVRFAGWMPPEDLRALLLRARALVFPSVCYEVFPVTIVEALAAGLPVLASGHGAPREVVAEVGEEWLAEPGNATAWAEALTRLTDDAAVDAAGARCREIYASRYAPVAGLASLERVYLDAIRDAQRVGV
jgi:glycosyltransferase involved in cell wall biosynthesis